MLKRLHTQLQARLHDAARTWAQPRGVPLRTPVHPGRFLERQFLKPLGLTQGQAAKLLGVSRRRLNEIVVGRRSLTADTALRCAMAFGLDASFWMALQSRWDSFQAWKAWRSAAMASGPTATTTASTASLAKARASAPTPLSRSGAH
jgi:addiction module HigA family antidote